MSKFNEDISDEEFEKYHIPFNNNLHEFMIKYVLPEVIAFQFANSYSRGCLCESTFEQHYRSTKDIFNVHTNPKEDLKIADTIFELLKVKYHLIITDDSPMKIEKLEQ